MLPHKVIYVQSADGGAEPADTVQFTEESWERFVADWKACKDTGSPTSGVYAVVRDGGTAHLSLDLEPICFVL